MQGVDIAAIVACILGIGLGGFAMVNPRWASKLVRWAPAPGTVEGKSEFRAPYGGFFVAGHLAVLGLMITRDTGYQAGAFVLGYCWLGSAVGRMISFVVGRMRTRLNIFNVAFEIVVATMLSAPYLSAYVGR